MRAHFWIDAAVAAGAGVVVEWSWACSDVVTELREWLPYYATERPDYPLR